MRTLVRAVSLLLALAPRCAGLRLAYANNSNAAIPRHCARGPRVHFLFMVKQHGVQNPDVWRWYFNSSDPKQWRILVHCEHEGTDGRCDSGLPASLKPKTVATQPTAWCSNVVSPMNELLRVALKQEAHYHPRDKFVFLAGDHLPVKPFWHAYDELTANEDSSFCVLPTARWNCSCSDGCLVKHSQWSILGIKHARTIVEEVTARGSTASGAPKMNVPGCPQEQQTCLDEYWHFNALYGTIFRPQGFVQLPLFNGGGLRAPSFQENLPQEQGFCPTFVHWPNHKIIAFYSGESPLRETTDQLKRSGVKWGGRGDHQIWGASAPAAIDVLFDSSYLFARKFAPLHQTVRVQFIQRLGVARGGELNTSIGMEQDERDANDAKHFFGMEFQPFEDDPRFPAVARNEHRRRSMAVGLKQGPARSKNWANRLLVVPELKFAFCYIDRNACAQFNILMNRLNGFDDFDATDPRLYRTSSAVGKFRLNISEITRENGWRKAVFMRDPADRFLSVWQSKCLDGEDRDTDCIAGLEDGEPPAETFQSAVEKLHGYRVEHKKHIDEPFNAFYDQQMAFCGGLDPEDYDFVGRLVGSRPRVHAQVVEMLSKVARASPDQLERADVDTLFPKTPLPLTMLSERVRLTDAYKDPEVYDAVRAAFVDDYEAGMSPSTMAESLYADADDIV
mmetsp:Transcript_105572/g.297053  ORF Transcript_105572/g.297053 Transcript_105572/m.297053 type:complete len:676 (+) Transcript_105572:74-2101(+)